MAITITAVTPHSAGDQTKVTCVATITSGTETVTAASLGLTYIEDGWATDSVGYTYDFTVATGGATATLAAYYVTSAMTSPLTALGAGVLAVAPKLVVYGR